MRNKIAMGIILLAVNSLALASGDQNLVPKKNSYFTSPYNIKYFSGLYLGAGVGVNYNSWRNRNDSNHVNEGQLTPSVSLSLGYGKAFTIKSLNSSFYLGGELSGLYSPWQDKDFSDEKFIVAPTVKLGYFLTPKTMIYALGGLSHVDLMTGLGVETMLSKKVSLSGQYMHTFYRHDDSMGRQLFQGALSMRLTYHFNGV